MNRKSSLIIVDDDMSLIKMLREALSLEGYQCETAPDAYSALDRIQDISFDFMIADVVLPDMNGLELTKRAKALRPEMAVIIMTGFLEDFTYDEVVEAGATDFIKKPFTIKEITARLKHVRMQEEMRSLMLRDQLTGVYNRRGFFTMVEHLFKVAKRKKRGMYMLYADLDNLKQINDKFGHQEGDAALEDIAAILKKNYRESDIIARIGGDEFVVIPVGTKGDRIETILERLDKAIESHNLKSSREYRLSISAGLAFYDPENPSSVDELLARGDRSMYERKKKKEHALSDL